MCDCSLLNVSIIGAQCVFQRLFVHIHWPESDTLVWLQCPELRWVHHERAQLHCERHKVLSPLQYQPVWSWGTTPTPEISRDYIKIMLFIPSSVFCQGHKAAVCRDNVTNLPNEDTEGGQLGSSVEAFLCQSTIIPSDGRGLRTALSSQSISLGDTFQGENIS